MLVLPSTQVIPQPVVPDIQNALTATGAAAAAVTLTIPSPGAGLSQFIYVIQINKFNTALLVAGAAPVTVTTTNLPGTPSFDFGADAATQGTFQTLLLQPMAPFKAAAPATAITIVCPATTSVIWKVTAFWANANN